LYRFGGQISLRGFNEEEIYATSRSVFGLEYRFLLDKNSYLFAFYDQAWYENKASTFVTDTPFGFGTGFTFGTAIGNFSVSYALGKQFDNLIQFRDGKIHFGYVAYF
jgi:hemolysin activation/secretion protein